VGNKREGGGNRYKEGGKKKRKKRHDWKRVKEINLLQKRHSFSGMRERGENLEGKKKKKTGRKKRKSAKKEKGGKRRTRIK